MPWISCASDPAPGEGAGGVATSSTAGTGADGGAGGAGGGRGGTGPASGSGGVSPDACDKLCDLFARLECDGPFSCLSTCKKWVERAGDCGHEMLAEIDCIADSTTECGQDVCQAEFAALDACAAGVDCFSSTSAGDGRGGDNTCTGSQGCSTGQVRMDCVQIDGGPIDCECFVGGELVGTCVNDIDNCQVDFNCCAQFW
jgi:hypothetical protein